MEKAMIIIKNGVTALSGFDYGKDCFEKYAKNIYLKNNDSVTIVIPDDVKRIGISFVQGFVSEVATKYGITNVSKHIIVESNNNKLVEKFNKSIKVYEYVK